MATNIDKALTVAPQGIEELAAGEQALEIEIIEDGVTPLDPGEQAGPELPAFDANLAEYLEEGVMTALANELSFSIDEDLQGRRDWERAYKNGLKLLGLSGIEERTEPWNGACGVFHPMITEAAVRFQAELITETFPAQGPVKAKIVGKETPEVKEAAFRVENDMNFELTEVMKEFRLEHERMLLNLPLTGSTFKKVYRDDTLGRQTSIFVPAEDAIMPYGTTDLDTCHRFTHVMRKTKNELRKLQKSGFYREISLPAATREVDDIKQAKDKETGANDVNDDRYTLYEVHADLVIKERYKAPEKDDAPIVAADGSMEISLEQASGAGTSDVEDGDEGDEIAYPHVVTFIKGTNTVLAVRRNWREEDELKRKRQHFVHYQYVPGLGAYGFGLIHLIGGYAAASTSILRQLVDAGTLSNLPGGLKTRGLRIKGDDTPIAPGEFRDVDVGSGTIKDNILPLPYKEPSMVLATLLDKIVEEGRRFAATADMKVSDMSAQAPVGTILALLERQLKTLTAVQARTHASLKQELGLIKGIIRDHSDEPYAYEPAYGQRSARAADYDMVDVIPVSDPNAATLSQRVVQHQAVIQMASLAPDIYDLPQLHRSMLSVLGINNAEKIVPLPEDQKPLDPVSENQGLLTGKPVKAFQHQDHAAHLAVHSMLLMDPMIAQSIGQNPRGPMIQGAIMSHMAEHTGFQMRQKIEMQLGMPLPPPGEPLPPQVEIALSGLMARAAAQVVQQDQAQAAAQQAAQQAQDPVIQMQQQELFNDGRELEIKDADQKRKAEEARERLVMERRKAEEQMANDREKLRIERERLKDERDKAKAQLRLDAIKLRQEMRDGALQRQTDERRDSTKSRIDTLNALAARRVPPINKGGDK